MAAGGSVPSASPRAALLIVAVTVLVLAGIGWAAGTAMTGVDHSARRMRLELIHGVPATHRIPPAAAAQPVPAPMGNWTHRLGVRIARRALHWLGWPYSFAAGGPDGPSYGVAVDRDSRHDASVYGFDCSGLTMYALAPWLKIDHYAASQYTEVGSFHPVIDQLEPGDLVFWSGDGTVQGIGHVAVYVGDGKVVQAPHSGDVIRVTPIDRVESGTMGATRPLT